MVISIFFLQQYPHSLRCPCLTIVRVVLIAICARPLSWTIPHLKIKQTLWTLLNSTIHMSWIPVTFLLTILPRSLPDCRMAKWLLLGCPLCAPTLVETKALMSSSMLICEWYLESWSPFCYYQSFATLSHV